MAQKINPVSFRLGVTQVWNSTLQIYGKSFSNYFLFLHKQLQIQNFIKRYFQTKGFQLNLWEWKAYQGKIFLNIYFSPFLGIKKNYSLIFLNHLSELVSKWFRVNFLVHFYLQLQWSLTSNFVVCYAKHMLEQKLSPKKVVGNLCKFLKLYLNSSKILYFKFGLFKTELVGFKIRLVGRFDGSNPMSKSFEQTVGALSLTNLSSFVEYSNTKFYTKLGICGIQIWLFYKTKKFENDNT